MRAAPKVPKVFRSFHKFQWIFEVSHGSNKIFPEAMRRLEGVLEDSSAFNGNSGFFKKFLRARKALFLSSQKDFEIPRVSQKISVYFCRFSRP